VRRNDAEQRCYSRFQKMHVPTIECAKPVAVALCGKNTGNNTGACRENAILVFVWGDQKNQCVYLPPSFVDYDMNGVLIFFKLWNTMGCEVDKAFIDVDKL
jgi:hypothetical protein